MILCFSIMQRLILPSFICLAICLHYATAQWPNWVLNKGVICEESCKQIKNCNPVNEFSACKCFPRQYVKKWLQYNTLPLEPALVCLMSWSGVVPECCSIYKKQKDFYKNRETDMAQELEQISNEKAQLGDENLELKKKLDSCQQDEGRTSNLTSNMLTLLVEQGRNQKHELEQLEKRLASEEDERLRLSDLTADMSNLTTSMLTTIGQQDHELNKLTQTLSSEPWKPFVTQLVKSVGGPKISFTVFLDHQIHLKYPETVKFNKVLSNQGGGYDSTTGIFTCPEAGTYLFSFAFSTCNNVKGEVILQLRVNTSATSTVSAIANPTAIRDQGGNTAVMRLYKGSTVAVVGGYYDDKCVVGLYHARYTTFSGVMLYK